MRAITPLHWTISILFFVLLSITAHGATIHVPGDAASIQDAIDLADHGDIVLVAPGTYVENINYLGKAIAVTSEEDAASTVIDGNQVDSVVTFDHQEGVHSILEGFTVTNGIGFAGGIACDTGASPLIRNNIIDGNHGNEGGGIRCYFGSPIIVENTISWNESESYGGGVYCFFSSALILNNRFLRNRSIDGALSLGGGLCCHDGSLQITNNIFHGNKAERGGAMYFGASDASVLTNNTIFNNTAIYEGGGLCCTSTEWLTVVNTILWGNQAPEGDQIRVGGAATPGYLSIQNSDVQGGKHEIHETAGSIVDWGAACIESNPFFVGPSEGDFHLRYTSPCRDAGDSTAPGLYITDFEHDPRIADADVDMGADEFFAHLYIKGDPVPGGAIEVVLVGTPRTAPTILWLGAGVFDPPLPTPYGFWALAPPLVMMILPAIPNNGALTMPVLVPQAPPPPYTIPMQALVGEHLTNLCLLSVMES